jgi:hypothetical protein
MLTKTWRRLKTPLSVVISIASVSSPCTVIPTRWRALLPKGR